GARRQPVADVVLVVGGDALQPADGDGFGLTLAIAALLDPAAPARRFTRPIAGPSQNPGQDVGLPVDELRVRVASRGNEPNVFGNGSVGRAGPLAIDDFVKIVGLRDIR